MELYTYSKCPNDASSTRKEIKMSRQYPSLPIPAVAAVIFQGHSVLLAKRASEPSKGQWSLPGGIIEVGETHKAALKREIREETGLEIEVGDLVKVIDRIVLDSMGKVKYHYVILDYWAEYKGGIARAASDVLSIMWVDIGSLGKWGLSPETRDVISKAHAMKAR